MITAEKARNQASKGRASGRAHSRGTQPADAGEDRVTGSLRCDGPAQPGSGFYTQPVASTVFDRITVDPGVLGGKPCIRGVRISVGMVVQMVAGGKSIDEILGEYPYLEREDI